MRKKEEFTAEEADAAAANIAEVMTVLTSVDPEMWSQQFDAIDQLRAIIIHRPQTLNMSWAEAVATPRPSPSHSNHHHHALNNNAVADGGIGGGGGDGDHRNALDTSPADFTAARAAATG